MTFKRKNRFHMGGILLLPAFALWAATSAIAQEGIIDAIDNETAVTAQSRQPQVSDYTFKKGDFRMLIAPSVSLELNDNINLSKNDPENDFIVRPAVGISASYPLSDRNILRLDVTAGYNEYLLHQSLSDLYLQSGSGLSFDLYVKDILINVHDYFNYTTDSAQFGAVANTANYGSFDNRAGLFATWTLKKLMFTVGYDHDNNFSVGGQFTDTDHSSELAYGRLGYDINSQLTAGLEGSGSFTFYRQNVLNDNESYSAGVYADWHPGSYLTVRPRAGYVIYDFKGTSQTLATSGVNSWYAALNITHQPCRWMDYTLEIGREESLGIQADLNKNWYVRPGIDWYFIKDFTFRTSFFFEHGDQGSGSVMLMNNKNLVSESYDWYGGEINLSHAITKRLTLAINYRITQRTSSEADRGYLQNVVGLQLTLDRL